MTDPIQDHNNNSPEDTMSALSNGSILSASPASTLPSAASSDPSDDPLDQVHAEQGFSSGAVIVAGNDALELSLEAGMDIDLYGQAGSDHVIRLSSLEHCMPRSYIRICFSYRLPDPSLLPEIEARLNNFIRRTVDAKPYLSGYVVAVEKPGNRVGAVELRFSNTDFLEYPNVMMRHLTPDEVPYSYDELDSNGLPPSVIRPELVSALKESADEDWAPVFRVQANVVEGGLIVSVYLHHCISDGTGFGLLVSGSVLHDDFAFDRHLDFQGRNMPSLSMRLDEFANHMSVVRKELSYSSANQINDRRLKCKTVEEKSRANGSAATPGRGCVIAFSLDKVKRLREHVTEHTEGDFVSRNDVLQALLWHSMAKARIPSLGQDPPVTTAKLLIPTNIRKKLKNALSESYFGAAVDFASVEMPLCHLKDQSIASFAQTARAIRKGINKVDEAYVRQAIALARHPNPKIDVRDLQASNMDRAKGADMYVTSWEKLRMYDATFEMGLGQPDWVRKPWSKDPGSCIVLPHDARKDYVEIVVQMAVADMGRLLEDSDFMEYVVRVVE